MIDTISLVIGVAGGAVAGVLSYWGIASSVRNAKIKSGKLKSTTSKRDIPLNDTAIKMIQELRKEYYFGENSPPHL